MRTLRAAAAALAAATVATLAPAVAPHAGPIAAPTAQAAAGYYAPPGVSFGYPANNLAQNRVLANLLANIRQTPAGEEIRVVGYSLALRPVTDALAKADKRGVNVQVVIDGHSKHFAAARELRSKLGGNPNDGSFLIFTKGSARGSSGVTHQKSWQFSRTGMSPWVTMVGSANLTKFSMSKQYTDMYSFVNRRDVYETFSSVFDYQKLNKSMRNPFRMNYMGRDRAYFFPGVAADKEPIYTTLKSLPNKGTTIHVAMHAWHDARGIRLANVLADKARKGAEVRVLMGEHVGRGSMSILRRAGIPTYDGTFRDGDHIHLKLMVVQFTQYGEKRQFISTGSDNWGDLSLRNDDVDVMIAADGGLYGRYVKFFNSIVAR